MPASAHVAAVGNDGRRTVREVDKNLELTDRSTAALLSSNGCLGILGNNDGHWFIHPIMRELVLEGGRARSMPHQDRDDYWYRVTKQAVLTGAPVPEEMPTWLTDSEGQKEESEAFSPGGDTAGGSSGVRPWLRPSISLPIGWSWTWAVPQVGCCWD